MSGADPQRYADLLVIYSQRQCEQSFHIDIDLSDRRIAGAYAAHHQTEAAVSKVCKVGGVGDQALEPLCNELRDQVAGVAAVPIIDRAEPFDIEDEHDELASS